MFCQWFWSHDLIPLNNLKQFHWLCVNLIKSSRVFLLCRMIVESLNAFLSMINDTHNCLQTILWFLYKLCQIRIRNKFKKKKQNKKKPSEDFWNLNYCWMKLDLKMKILFKQIWHANKTKLRYKMFKSTKFKINWKSAAAEKTKHLLYREN